MYFLVTSPCSRDLIVMSLCTFITMMVDLHYAVPGLSIVIHQLVITVKCFITKVCTGM